MTPESLVARIQNEVLVQNLAAYQGLLDNTSPEAATDPYWKQTLALYRSLDERSRRVLIEIMRQVSVDTVSSLFGILDGTITLEDTQDELLLTTTANSTKLNGNLQDIFLAEDERNR